MSNSDAIARTTMGAYIVNDDRHLVLPDVPLYAVLDADVHRGHGADVVLDVFARDLPTLRAARQRGPVAMAEALRTTIESANTALLAMGATPEWRGIGSAITCCALANGHAVIAHVGDSRMYARRDGAWHRVTTDHTMIEELRANGTPEQLQETKELHANVITRALGFVPDVKVDVDIQDLDSVDALLLCTDGAWSSFDPDFDGRGPDGPHELDRLATWIFDRHHEAGGRANATIVLVPIDR